MLLDTNSPSKVTKQVYKFFSQGKNIDYTNTMLEYNKYFGTELFYQNTNKWHKIINGTKVKTDFDAYGLDAYGYLPLGCDQVIAPFATVGIANYNFGGDNDDNGLGYRLGGGIQYHITNNIALRAMGRYVWTDKLEGLDHMSEFSIGLKYLF